MTSNQPNLSLYRRKLMARIFIGSAIAIVGLSAAFVACQPSEKQPPLPGETEATMGQTSAFDNSVKAIGRVENVVSMIKHPETVAQDAMAEQLKQALVAANCVVESETATPNAQEVITTLKVSGATCPMTADYKKHVIKNGKVTGTISFKITDPHLGKLNDVYSMQVAGDGSSYSGADEERTQLSLSGEAVSVAYGKMNIALIHSMKSISQGPDVTQSGLQQIAFQFPEFKIVLKADVRIINTSDYSSFTMNNKPITQEEYLSYTKPLGIVFN